MKNLGFTLLLVGFGLLFFQQFGPGVLVLLVGILALVAARFRVKDTPVEPPRTPRAKTRTSPSPPAPKTHQALPKSKPQPKPRPKSAPRHKPATPKVSAKASPKQPSPPTPNIEAVTPTEPEWVPTIVTRTGENESGTELIDPWKDGDKEWTPEEDLAILEEYAKGNNLVLVSRVTVQDMQQVAIRLTRLLLDPQGDLRDDSAAHQHGRPYLPGEKDVILAEYEAGANLDELARSHERTLLGIGWQILNHPNRPTKLNDVAVARLLERSRGKHRTTIGEA
jgi:hypothetical protein